MCRYYSAIVKFAAYLMTNQQNQVTAHQIENNNSQQDEKLKTDFMGPNVVCVALVYMHARV